MDEIELREKQLAAMRVDVCSTVALKKLKGCCCVHIITNLYMGLNAILRVFFFIVIMLCRSFMILYLG